MSSLRDENLAQSREPALDETRAETAYRFLRNAIFSNAMPAHYRATEVQIAARLGMSRTPVHEAMARLQEEGLVEIMPRKGILVKPLSPDDVLEIYEVLIALEGAAAERLAGLGDGALSAILPQLETATEEMEAALKSDDLEAWAQADQSFHDALVEASGNRRIGRMAEMVTGQSHRARRLSLHLRPRPDGSAGEHRAIIAAIRAGDALAAGEAARSHRRGARDQIVPILRRINIAAF